MKKTFSPKRNLFSNRAGVTSDGAALVFVLLALGVRFVAPDAFWHVFAPAFRASEALAGAVHTGLSSFSDAAELAARNERLVSENAALTNEIQALRQKDADVSALESGADGRKGILAGVVARPPQSPYDTLVIAAGSAQGVKEGMEAFGAFTAGEGAVPIGIVSSASDSFSRVTLFSAPGATTNGWVGNTLVPVSIVGAGAGALRASVSRSATVAVGDTVSVAGPGALPLGSVVRIDSDQSLPESMLQISPAINLFSITWVELRDTGAVSL